MPFATDSAYPFLRFLLVQRFCRANLCAFIAENTLRRVFAAAGFLTAMLMTKNDGLVLNDANKTAELKIGEVYTEQNARFTLWGKDASDLVKIEVFDGDGEKAEKVDTSAAGEYFVVYSINTEAASGFLDKLVIGKYKKYKQVRQITVAE